MRTSATITNRMVRNNSLPDRPMCKRRASRGTSSTSGSLVGSVPGSNRASTEDSQPSYDAPHPGARQTRREKVDGRALVDFRQRRIGQHDAGESPDIEALRDGKRPGRDQFAGLGADNRRTDYFAILLRYDLDVAVGLALGLGAIVVMIGPAQNTDLDAALARLGLGQPALRQFRLGIGHPRNDVVVHAHRKTEQRIPDHQTGVIIGGMGELQLSRRTVADRIDASVGGLEFLVYHNPR